MRALRPRMRDFVAICRRVLEARRGSLDGVQILQRFGKIEVVELEFRSDVQIGFRGKVELRCRRDIELGPERSRFRREIELGFRREIEFEFRIEIELGCRREIELELRIEIELQFKRRIRWRPPARSDPAYGDPAYGRATSGSTIEDCGSADSTAGICSSNEAVKASWNSSSRTVSTGTSYGCDAASRYGAGAAAAGGAQLQALPRNRRTRPSIPFRDRCRNHRANRPQQQAPAGPRRAGQRPARSPVAALARPRRRGPSAAFGFDATPRRGSKPMILVSSANGSSSFKLDRVGDFSLVALCHSLSRTRTKPDARDVNLQAAYQPNVGKR